MNYLKNAVIAQKYQVSDPTVGKWIKLAQKGENNLELKKVKNKHYIINNDANHQVLRFLAQKGAKYRNKIGYEKVYPDPEIYKIFNESQLIELVINLKKKVLPTKFTFFNKGADLWNEHVQRDLVTEKGLDYISKTITYSLDYIYSRLREYEKVNIVNISPESNYPAEVLVAALGSSNKEIKYHIVHASEDMIAFLKEDAKKRFGDMEKTYEIADVENTVLRDLLYREKNRTSKKTCNVILMLEMVLGNHVDRINIFKNFSNSMSDDDYFLFDAEIRLKKDYELVQLMLNRDSILAMDCWLIEIMGVPKESFERTQKFVEKIDSQANVYRFKKDIDICFQWGQINDIVSFRQGDELVGIFIHSFNLNNLIKEVQDADLNISHLSAHPDKSEIFMMCEVLKT